MLFINNLINSNYNLFLFLLVEDINNFKSQQTKFFSLIMAALGTSFLLYLFEVVPFLAMIPPIRIIKIILFIATLALFITAITKISIELDKSNKNANTNYDMKEKCKDVAR